MNTNGKNSRAAVPGIGVDHVGDEFVHHLGDRLPSAGHQRRPPRAEQHQRGDQQRPRWS